jgi:DNA polymerase III alpha subunit
MKDKFGRVYFTEDEAVRLVYKKPKVSLEDLLLKDPTKFNKAVSDLYSDLPNIKQYTDLEESIEEFDKARQQDWFMPKEYIDFDIAKWVLEQCNEDAELQRAGKELMAYQDRGLMPLLNFMYYLVQIMKKHNVVWGVGRGSSVSSFVLYKIGINRINPMYYSLDFSEFLR